MCAVGAKPEEESPITSVGVPVFHGLEATINSRPSRSVPQKDVNGNRDADRSAEVAAHTPAYRSEGASPDRSPSALQMRSPKASNLLRTATLFMCKFPELGFLHKPTFSLDLRNLGGRLHQNAGDRQPKAELLGSALRALCLPLTEPNHTVEDTLNKVHRRLSITEPPHIYVVQTLLVVSMFEWGQGNTHAAWMYSGAAIRMMQLLKPAVLTSSDSLEREIHNRTLWSCFIMDRLIFPWSQQSLCLPMEEMATHWPVGDADYAFAQGHIQRYMVPSRYPMTVDYSYAVLVHGFDIWTKIYRWIISGGRRRKDMQLGKNFPWEESSLWATMRGELQEWRDSQDPKLWYPANRVGIYESLGKGEVFGYLNLIYYVSILFLNREYIPFLPWPNSTPCGPVDPPLFTAKAPEGWWEVRSEEIFNAASCITSVLTDLTDEEAPLYTPFAGFCNFSAATMNIYVLFFPSMNMGRSGDMGVLVDKNLAYLDQFRSMWPIGQGWWTTIQRTKAIYERHSQDPARYLGKTRDDFIGLMASIHNVTERSRTPVEHEISQTPDDALVAGEDGGSAVQGFAIQSQGQVTEDLIPQDFWGNEWPLWGELDNVSFNSNLLNH
ncbi:granaticin polyketide synthase putative ketoacyl reductase 2 [Aspergillus udagawae]|nr:granaticin polyketide synthase putative ketoacyl reductase 2 [Aspergillus udagawae]